MRSERKALLGQLEVGDVIFAIAGGGQEKLMLVYKAEETRIFARHVTTQTIVEFGRDGQSRVVEGGGTCTIVSVAPLPPDDYATVLGLDRKMRLAQPPHGLRLSDAEVRLLSGGYGYYKANFLPSE